MTEMQKGKYRCAYSISRSFFLSRGGIGVASDEEEEEETVSRNGN